MSWSSPRSASRRSGTPRSHVHQPTWAEWLVVPAVFLGCNLFEWALHRFLLHRPVPGFMGIYKRHTLAHHQFFTDHEPTIDDTRDFRITFFPPYALTTFICMSAAGALGAEPDLVGQCRLAAGVHDGRASISITSCSTGAAM